MSIVIIPLRLLLLLLLLIIIIIIFIIIIIIIIINLNWMLCLLNAGYHSSIWQLSTSCRVMRGAAGSAVRSGARTAMLLLVHILKSQRPSTFTMQRDCREHFRECVPGRCAAVSPICAFTADLLCFVLARWCMHRRPSRPASAAQLKCGWQHAPLEMLCARHRVHCAQRTS